MRQCCCMPLVFDTRLVFYAGRVPIEDGNNTIQVTLVKVLGFDRGDRADGRLIDWLGAYQFGFGQIEAGQHGIEMEVQVLRVAHLAID